MRQIWVPNVFDELEQWELRIKTKGQDSSLVCLINFSWGRLRPGFHKIPAWNFRNGRKWVLHIRCPETTPHFLPQFNNFGQTANRMLHAVSVFMAHTKLNSKTYNFGGHPDAKTIGVMPASDIVSHPNSCWIMIAEGNHPANCSSVGWILLP